jgi:hypothetical protein
MTLQEFVRSVDEEGRMTFPTSEYRNFRREEGETPAKYHERLVLVHLMDFDVLVTYFKNSKSLSKRIDLRATPTEDGGDMMLSFNLAKALRFPAENPAQELREFADFLDAQKPYYHARASGFPYLQVLSVWSRRKPTAGDVKCGYRNAAGKHFYDEEASQAILAMMQASPVLSRWLLQQARDLSRARCSSFVVRHEHLFKAKEDPVLKALDKQMAAERRLAAQKH